jgi:hypothetical protein
LACCGSCFVTGLPQAAGSYIIATHHVTDIPNGARRKLRQLSTRSRVHQIPRTCITRGGGKRTTLLCSGVLASTLTTVMDSPKDMTRFMTLG